VPKTLRQEAAMDMRFAEELMDEEEAEEETLS